MSAAKFLTTDTENTVASSVKMSLRDLRNPDALGGKRSEYSLPINGGKEMPINGAYGTTNIPAHAIEALGMSSPLGDTTSDIPATRA